MTYPNNRINKHKLNMYLQKMVNHNQRRLSLANVRHDYATSAACVAEIEAYRNIQKELNKGNFDE